MNSPVTLLIIVAFVLLFFIWSRRRPGGARQPVVVENPRVAVVSLGDEPLAGIGETDARIYSAHFPDVEMTKLETTGALLDLVGNERPDILHLYCSVNEGGEMSDAQGGRLGCGELLEACRGAGVKLLFFASDNPGDNYVSALRDHRRGAGRGVDLVLTIERSGDKFPFFLGELLRRMSQGQSMAMAWVSIAPQAQGAWMDKLPGTIYMPDR